MSLWIALACTLLAEFWVLRRLRFDGVVTGTVLAGTLVHVHYLSYTSITERNIDASSHVAYVQAIARELRPPDVFACGVCGHPPLYYALAALWSKLMRPGEWAPLELVLNWFSLVLFFGFVVVALLILRSRLEKPPFMWLAAALVVFWPSSILNSVRVHNDALASPLILASTYLIARWDEHDRPHDFLLALATAALALLTKASGYAVAAALVLFALGKLLSAGWDRERLKQCAGAILVLTSTAILATAARQSREPRTPCHRVLGHACGGRYVPPVADDPSRFLSFDVVRFVRRLDAVPEDRTRDYFLNRFAKSSLFGIKPLGDELTTKRHVVLGAVISSLLLVMATVCTLGAAFLRGVHFRKYRAYVVTSALLVGLLLAFRIRLPNPHHEDFRHVFPLLVPFCLGYVAVVARLARIRPLLGKLGLAVGSAMVVASVAFFVRLP
jgi:hypothetical protein